MSAAPIVFDDDASPSPTGSPPFIGYVPNSDGSEGQDGERSDEDGDGSSELGWVDPRRQQEQQEQEQQHQQQQPSKKRKLSESVEPRARSVSGHQAEQTQAAPPPTASEASAPHPTSVVPHQGSMNGAPAHHPYPGLIMPSFFGIAPMDEFARMIGTWLVEICNNVPEPEIEIKFGTLVDKRSRRRIQLPIRSECILSDDMDVQFQSEMTMRQHRQLNQYLNAEVTNCAGRAPHPSLPPHTYYPISYRHTYITDHSYSASEEARQAGLSHARRRVSTDTKTGQVVAVVEKRKVGNMNVHSPNSPFDWRISVNSEVPCEFQDYRSLDIPWGGLATESSRPRSLSCFGTGAPPGPHEKPTNIRRKDRLTYKHSLFQVDLTQVQVPSASGSDAKIHELEIEVLHPTEFLYQGFEHQESRPSNWEEQLACIFNTVRLLNRNAGPP